MNISNYMLVQMKYKQIHGPMIALQHFTIPWHTCGHVLNISFGGQERHGINANVQELTAVRFACSTRHRDTSRMVFNNLVMV